MNSASSPSEEISTDTTAAGPEGDFWDNPEGNPDLSDGDSEYTSPWRRDSVNPIARQSLNPSPSGIFSYSQPIQYQVRKTGYYCVGKIWHP